MIEGRRGTHGGDPVAILNMNLILEAHLVLQVERGISERTYAHLLGISMAILNIG